MPVARDAVNKRDEAAKLSRSFSLPPRFSVMAAAASSFGDREALREAAADVALEEGVAWAADQRRDARPSGTKKVYLPRQAEFKEWARRKGFRDGARVTGPKLCLFLQEEVVNRRPKKRRRLPAGDGDPVAVEGEEGGEGGVWEGGEAPDSGERLSVSTTKGYVAAVKDLWVYQNTVRGYARTEDPRAHEGVRAVLDTVAGRASDATKSNYRLTGAGSLSEGLGPVAKRRAISAAWLEQGSLVGLRNRAMFAICYDSALRGEDARGLELADLSFHFLEKEGPAGAYLFSFHTFRGKRNQNGNVRSPTFNLRTYASVSTH